MKKAAGIIPARYGSSRFPGKALSKIKGKYLVERVYERARQAKLLERLIIATDDDRIWNAAKKFGAEAVMTSPEHHSGTERVAEIAETIDSSIIINIQGDEPLLHGEMVDLLVSALQDERLSMATLVSRQTDRKLFHDTNAVKVVVDRKGNALYFSRAAIPSQIDDAFYLHIGLYGYQRDFLIRFAHWPPSRLEQLERLEQLRALEYGYTIKTIETSFITHSVDTPEDISRVEKLLEGSPHV